MQILEMDSGLNNRNLMLFGDITVENITPLVESIYAFNKEDEHITPESREPINIYINSGGGEVAAGMSMVTAIESSDTPIHTHAIGDAMSCALLIFAVGHKRYAYKHSDFMYHALSGVHAGSIQRTRKLVEKFEREQKKFDDILRVYTKFPQEKLEQIVKEDQDYFFDYLEAYELGVTDFIEVSERYEEDCALIKEKYPEPEVIEIDDEDLLSTIPREKLLELYKEHHNGLQSGQEDRLV